MSKQLLVLLIGLLGAPRFALAKNPVTTVHFEYQNGVPYVQVISTNGRFRPMRFILDTGASPTVFDRFISASLNLQRFPEVGGCGDAPAMYVRQVHASCAGLPLKQVALSTDLVKLSMGCGHWVDGLLGTDYFRDKIVTIDFKNRCLQIQEPDSKSIAASLFDGISFCDRHDSVFVAIQTPKARRPLVFLLDTGSTRTFIDLKLAGQLGMNLSIKGQPVRAIGRDNTAFESNAFAGTCYGHPLASKIYASDFSYLSWQHSRHIDGILGTDFLQAFKVHINFQTREVQFD